MDTISGYSGKSYEKNVQRKDPGNRANGVHGARAGKFPGRTLHEKIRNPVLDNVDTSGDGHSVVNMPINAMMIN